MQKLSLKDIAHEAGVSVTTVSFVLNGKAKEKRISESASAKVLEIINRRNFSPNVVARGLRTGKTMSIGLIVEDIANHFFGNIAKVVEMEAYKNGYKVMYCSTDGDEKKARDLLLTMKTQQVDGFIITPTEGLKTEVMRLKEEKRPFVLFDRYFPDVPTSYVLLDNFKGALQMTQAMIRKGYRHIGFISIASAMNQMQERLAGYQQACEQTKMGGVAQQVLQIPFDRLATDGLPMMLDFFRAHPQLDAVLFGTNYLGILGIEALQQLQKSIPADMGVASFDDHDLFRLQKPAIAVVQQPLEKMGEAVIQILLHLIKTGKQAPPVQKKLPPVLQLRDSL